MAFIRDLILKITNWFWGFIFLIIIHALNLSSFTETLCLRMSILPSLKKSKKIVLGVVLFWYYYHYYYHFNKSINNNSYSFWLYAVLWLALFIIINIICI